MTGFFQKSGGGPVGTLSPSRTKFGWDQIGPGVKNLESGAEGARAKNSVGYGRKVVNLGTGSVDGGILSDFG